MVNAVDTPRARVYGLLDDNRRRLETAIEGLLPAQMTAPRLGDWSVKDVLTHITSWEELMLIDLERIRLGRVPGLASQPQEATDKWNETLMSVRLVFPLEQVMAEFTETRTAVMAALERLPDEAFSRGWVAGSCQVSALHDWEHATEIARWRDSEGL
jgi:hypothetical protein